MKRFMLQGKDEEASRARTDALAMMEEKSRLESVVAQKEREIEQAGQAIESVVARRDAVVAEREASEAESRVRFDEMSRIMAMKDDELRSKGTAIDAMAREVDALHAKQADVDAKFKEKDADLNANREELQRMDDQMKAQREKIKSQEAVAALKDLEIAKGQAREVELRLRLEELCREMAEKDEDLTSKSAVLVERAVALQDLENNLRASQEEAHRMADELAREVKRKHAFSVVTQHIGMRKLTAFCGAAQGLRLLHAYACVCGVSPGHLHVAVRSSHECNVAEHFHEKS